MESTKTQMKQFKTIIDNIVTDILAEGTYDDFMNLQDPQTCNAHIIFLEEELIQRFKKIQILEFAQGIYVSPHPAKPCEDEKCSNIEKPKYGVKGNLKSKAQICRAIAVYYIRIFNVIGAIMAAIDPENNMCLRRLNALYEPIKGEPGFGNVSICTPDKELYPDSFLKVEGMKELLSLYQMYNVEGLKSQHEAMKSEIEDLQLKIQKIFRGGKQSKGVKTEIVAKPIEEEQTAKKNNGTKKNNRNNAKNMTKKNRANNGKNAVPTTNAKNAKNATNAATTANSTVNTVAKNAAQNAPGANATAKNAAQNAPGANTTATTNAAPKNTTTATNAPTTVAPPLPGGPTDQGVEVSESESSNSNSIKGGGRRRTRKNRQQGGGFFDFLGFGDDEKGTPENLPTAEAPVEENVEVAREDLKTLRDFKEFMKARKVPKDILADGSNITVSSFPINYSKHPKCKVTGARSLNRKIKFDEEGPFAEYFKNYKVINEHYKKETKELKDILTEKLLVKTNNRFTVQNISSNDLLEIEKKTRETLVNYYTVCQKLFSKSWKSLVRGVNNSLLEKERKQFQQEEEELDEDEVEELTNEEELNNEDE